MSTYALKRKLGGLFAVAVFVVVIAAGALVVRRLDLRPRTDDAFLLADIANIAPDVSGRITSLNVHNNQFVHAGDVLFVIDQEPYPLRPDAARGQLALASATLERSEPLVGKGYVTPEQIDQQRTAKESARASEALAERDLRNTTVKAPFDGKIAGL